MASRKQQKPVTRVELRSPASGGSAFVPEGRVEEFLGLGWRRVEAKPARRTRKADESDEK